MIESGQRHAGFALVRIRTATANYWQMYICQSKQAYYHLMKKHVLFLKKPEKSPSFKLNQSDWGHPPNMLFKTFVYFNVALEVS